MTMPSFAVRLLALMLPALLVGALFGSLLYNTARAAADTPASTASATGAQGAIVTSPALEPQPLPTEPGPVVNAALEAAKAGEYKAGALLMLAAIVLVIRLLWSKANTKLGGWISNFSVSALMLGAAAAKAGEGFSLSLLLSIVVLSLSAAGGVALVKDVAKGAKGATPA
jgi:hypothetical protein